ncbi:hypothetical protein Hdeb2414_s0016g00488721 [Helianthus debilis subsp. tardiflorus]
MNKTKLLHCLQSGRGTLCCHLQMLQPLSWMHRQELCKEHYILEDYTGDFHIQTHIVAEMVCLAHRRDGVLVRSKCFPSCLRDSILLWQNTMLQSGQRTGRCESMGGETVCSTSLNNLPSRNCLATNATMLIEA